MRWLPRDQERPFEEPGALIVEELLDQRIFDKLGNHDNNMPIGVLSESSENVLNDGNDDEAVGRWQSGGLGGSAPAAQKGCSTKRSHSVCKVRNVRQAPREWR